MVLDEIKKALEAESVAVTSYMHALRVLRLYGADLKDLETIIKKVAIDTLLHKWLMDGMLKAYEEAYNKDAEIMRDIEEVKPSAAEKALMVKLLKDHLSIESDMIELYKELARSVQYPILRELSEALAKNEEEHHRLISDLIKKYEAQ